jgi:hypothetical protein
MCVHRVSARAGSHAITHEFELPKSARKPAEHAATQRLLLQYRTRPNEVKDFRHKAQDLRVFLRKLVQLREVPRRSAVPGGRTPRV